MFIYGAAFFLFKPGIAMLALGILLTLPLSLGPITIGPITLSLFWMLLGVTLALIGLQSFFLGCIAQVFFDYTGAARRRWLSFFPYTRTVLLSVGLFLVGIGLSSSLAVDYVKEGYALYHPEPYDYLAVTGLLLMLAAFMTFTFTLMLHAAVLRKPCDGLD